MVQEDAVPSVDVLDGPLDEVGACGNHAAPGKAICCAPSAQTRTVLPPQVEIIPLGGAQEVGRSCIYLRWRGRSLLLDCGLHPGALRPSRAPGHSISRLASHVHFYVRFPRPAAFKGRHSLPYLEEVDLESVEAVLVTHFHHDHCAALPYLVGQTNFKGRVLMTHPTRAVLGTLLRDTVRYDPCGLCSSCTARFASCCLRRVPPFRRLDMSSGEEPLYTEADVEEAMRRTEVISFRQTKDLGGIAITALAAGHVLGAAMYLIEWDGLRVLYTGGSWQLHFAASAASPASHAGAVSGNAMTSLLWPCAVHPLLLVTNTCHLLFNTCLLSSCVAPSCIAGDYSRVPDRHLSAADLPTTPPHIVIVEATCGIAQHESRAEREAKLTNAVARIVSNGGRVLIPCVAIGRAQEILLVLEEFWERNPAFQNVPIYQVRVPDTPARIFKQPGPRRVSWSTAGHLRRAPPCYGPVHG